LIALSKTSPLALLPNSSQHGSNVNALEDPSQSHFPSTFRISGVLSESDSTLKKANKAMQLGYRYGFHSLMDPEYGYERGLGIEYLKVTFEASQSEAFLKELTPFSIESLNHFDSLTKQISYRARLSYLKPKQREDLVETELATGLAQRWGKTTAYLLGTGQLVLNFAKDSNQTRSQIDADAGVALGLYQSFFWNGRMHLEVHPKLLTGPKALMRMQIAPFFKVRLPSQRNGFDEGFQPQDTLAFQSLLEIQEPWNQDQKKYSRKLELGTVYFF
jgi:hypothetical protein